MAHTYTDAELRAEFEHTDRNNSGTIEISELRALLKRLNINLSKSRLKAAMRAAVQFDDKPLNFDQFVRFYGSLIHVEIIHETFDAYAKNNVIKPDDFARFMRDSQKQELDEYKEMDFDAFQAFILSENNHICDPCENSIHQDMNQPLTHYWINSSHNTYLEGDQLKGKSSIQAYITAFEEGCKCVELDVWDGTNGEPCIYHGHTFTSKILLRDVVKCVREYAFKISPYPVILSIENHCSAPFQVEMTNIFKEILGDMLASPVDELPSPESLLNKVLIKGKTVPKSPEEEEEDSDDEEVDKKAKKKKKKTKITPEFSSIVFLRAVHFHSFDEKGKTFEMSSFAEGKATKFVETQKDAFMAYTQRQLARIYPLGLRVDSSNYDPIPFWNTGCQIVALNFQTHGPKMNINTGRFLANGGCGYVLKPPSLMGMGKAVPAHLTVRILCAGRLPKPQLAEKGEIVDPYVLCEIAGVTKKTKTVNDNGWNPVYNEEFEYDIPDVATAVLRFQVKDNDKLKDDTLCQYSLPLDAVRSGVRFMPLKLPSGKIVERAFLLVTLSLKK